MGFSSPIFGLVAQWIEHLPSKQTVMGSSPIKTTNFLIMGERRKSNLGRILKGLSEGKPKRV